MYTKLDIVGDRGRAGTTKSESEKKHTHRVKKEKRREGRNRGKRINSYSLPMILQMDIVNIHISKRIERAMNKRRTLSYTPPAHK